MRAQLLYRVDKAVVGDDNVVGAVVDIAQIGIRILKERHRLFTLLRSDQNILRGNRTYRIPEAAAELGRHLRYLKRIGYIECCGISRGAAYLITNKWPGSLQILLKGQRSFRGIHRRPVCKFKPIEIHMVRLVCCAVIPRQYDPNFIDAILKPVTCL